MRERYRRGKTGVLISLMTIGAESLMIVAGAAIRFAGAEIEPVSEDVLQFMHLLLH